MGDFVKIINDQIGWYHVYEYDADILHTLTGYFKYKRNGKDTIGFPIEQIHNVIRKLNIYKINYKIDDDEIISFCNNQYNNYIYNNGIKKEKVITGSFIIKFNNEIPEKYIIGENINHNAEIIDFVLNNDIGTSCERNEEIVSIIDKKLDVKYYKDGFLYNDNNIRVDVLKLKEKFIDKIKEYNDYGFIHATSFNNLESIYNLKCLCSRNYLNNNNIKFDDNACHEVLDMTHNFVKSCVRFYFREKTPALYKFYENKNICILIFDYNLFLDSKNGFVLNKIPVRDVNRYNIDKENDLVNLINNFNYNLTFNKNYCYDLKKDYKGAELLINSNVSIKYIKQMKI